MSLGKNKTFLQSTSSVDATGYFKPYLYTGAGNIAYTGMGFKPDLIIIKRRDSTSDHYWFDSTRGPGKAALLNTDAYAEIDNSTYQTSFDTDGFTLGSNSTLSGTGKTFVAWSYKANGGTTSSNTDGSITTTIQTNPDFGAASPFSIIKYQGNGTSGATVGHGLGQQVKLAVFFNLDAGTYNYVYYDGLTGSSYNLYWNTADAEQNDNVMQGGSASTITISNSTSVNGSGTNYICYAWANIAGVQQIGTYAGNNNVSGPTISTGFTPRYVLVKGLNIGDVWEIYDSSRSTSNPRNDVLYANLTHAEQTNLTNKKLDFLATGFQPVGTDTSINGNYNYLYWAIA